MRGWLVRSAFGLLMSCRQHKAVSLWYGLKRHHQRWKKQEFDGPIESMAEQSESGDLFKQISDLISNFLSDYEEA